MERRLWYQEAAKIWEEAMPLGNGRLGAMVFGGVHRECIQMNEESLWQGSRKNRSNPDCKKYLPKIREALFDGRIREGEALMKLAMTSFPQRKPSYQPLGNLVIDLSYGTGDETRDYVRELDLSSAVSKVSYTKGATRYHREMLISNPSDLMVMKYTAKGEEKLNLTINLDREGNAYDGICAIDDHTLLLYGNQERAGLEFTMMVRVKKTDGKCTAIGGYLKLEDASEAEILLSGDCSYHYGKNQREHAVEMYHSEAVLAVKDWEEETKSEKEARYVQYCIQHMMYDHMKELMDAAKAKSYEKLKEDHIADYQKLFGRLSLDLGEDEFAAVPTDQRLLAMKNGEMSDRWLSALYLDFGRYLLISCSRPGNLPANLQGIWNQKLQPNWESGYTININTEMNYWLAEKGNLSECHQPLFDHLQRMLLNGQRTAKELYGCEGFVAHHGTDLYGSCEICDCWNPGSYWAMGGAWLSTHIWEHYQYTKDQEFLKKNFVLLEESVKFFHNFLVEYKENLVTCPSASPENSFLLPNGEEGANIYGVTMDNQILRDLCNAFLGACTALGQESAQIAEAEEILEKLIPTQIAKNGCIMEWPEEFVEKEPGHRHISHLYGLHPSEQISMDGTPELAAAARRTLERRLAHGGGHTGWSKAWIINHYAKLWDGELAYKNLQELLAGATYPNMFDAHPPFQIDGNFGAAAGILEMLVQSNGERIVLLPALPKAWKDGHLRGVPVKGGAVLDISWKDGKLLEVLIHAPQNCPLTFVYQGASVCMDGETSRLSEADF